ncbi:MAG: hypothetical protein AB7K71_33385 [Polyangiaceae bacterium]
MKVHQLIELLSDLDPEANVLLMHQPRWPFEYSISGIAVRKDYDEREGEGMKPTDVLLCEGQQIRYGDRDGWDVLRRP